MASRKKPVKKEESVIIEEKEPVIIDEKDILSTEEVNKLEPEKIVEIKAPIVKVKPAKTQKYSIGNIVFVSKDTEADLNGFKLFPPYKKYTYTVEAYDPITDVYSLRRLNLLLKLKEEDIVAPGEKSDSSLIRRQF